MKGEINLVGSENFFCSAGKSFPDGRGGFYACLAECGKSWCGNYHRKYPTPEQFKEEYGEKYPDGGAVYCYTFDGGGYSWVVGDYKWAKEWKGESEPIVCACTPWGCPPKEWRPK